jgi:hypothetical protein
MAVLWADVSYYQPVVNDSYPHPVLCIRSNDGTYRDTSFAANMAWAKRAITQGRLQLLIVYCVYRQNWEQTANTLIDMVGRPFPQLAIMIDVESWGGQITGDHSGKINSLYWRFAEWLGDRRKVIGYGNRGDLTGIWPTKPEGVKLVVASYGRIPQYPGMFAHQYGSDVPCSPFGPCDANSANDHTIQTLLSAVGVRDREREVLHTMERLPATSAPRDPNSDPRTWEARNWTVYFDGAGGWEGDCAITFGCQDWSGRTVSTARAYLEIATWKMGDGSFVPVVEGANNDTPFVQGRGRPIPAHGAGQSAGPWLAPHGAIGITLNYAAPGEGCVAVGRSA